MRIRKSKMSHVWVAGAAVSLVMLAGCGQDAEDPGAATDTSTVEDNQMASEEPSSDPAAHSSDQSPSPDPTSPEEEAVKPATLEPVVITPDQERYDVAFGQELILDPELQEYVVNSVSERAIDEWGVVFGEPLPQPFIPATPGSEEIYLVPPDFDGPPFILSIQVEDPEEAAAQDAVLDAALRTNADGEWDPVMYPDSMEGPAFITDTIELSVGDLLVLPYTDYLQLSQPGGSDIPDLATGTECLNTDGTVGEQDRPSEAGPYQTGTAFFAQCPAVVTADLVDPRDPGSEPVHTYTITISE